MPVEFLTEPVGFPDPRVSQGRARQGVRSCTQGRIHRRKSPDVIGQPHGNEHREFDDEDYMRRRDASINDYQIEESERRIF